VAGIGAAITICGGKPQAFPKQIPAAADRDDRILNQLDFFRMSNRADVCCARSEVGDRIYGDIRHIFEAIPQGQGRFCFIKSQQTAADQQNDWLHRSDRAH
jgi:hypothetical protein